VLIQQGQIISPKLSMVWVSCYLKL